MTCVQCVRVDRAAADAASSDDALIQIGKATENDLLVSEKAFQITKEGQDGLEYLCNTRAYTNDTKLAFKGGNLWNATYKDTNKCLYFWDTKSQTFVNVEESDKSVFISKRADPEQANRTHIELMLASTNKYAPGRHPYTYGGPSGR